MAQRAPPSDRPMEGVGSASPVRRTAACGGCPVVRRDRCDGHRHTAPLLQCRAVPAAIAGGSRVAALSVLPSCGLARGSSSDATDVTAPADTGAMLQWPRVPSQRSAGGRESAAPSVLPSCGLARVVVGRDRCDGIGRRRCHCCDARAGAVQRSAGEGGVRQPVRTAVLRRLRFVVRRDRVRYRPTPGHCCNGLSGCRRSDRPVEGVGPPALSVLPSCGLARGSVDATGVTVSADAGASDA
jgi:hypothetical protein